MRCVWIREPGGPEVLELRDVPDPVPGPGEVVVRVRASALNRADLLQRRGRYPAPPGSPPHIPGLEFAGEVEGTGRPVMGILGGGGHADKVAVPSATLLPVPPGMGWDEAAAVPEAFLTAYDALTRQAGIAAGDDVLIRAAGSGVGIAAMQWARACGASPIGTSRSAGKRSKMLDMGFGDVRAPDDPLADDSIDVVLDPVGGPDWGRLLEALREGGRIVQIGVLAGSRADIDLGRLLRTRARIVGTVLRARSVDEKAALTRAFEAEAMERLIDGTLFPVIDRVVPLERVADAHDAMERNENFGKIVLRIA